jgi:hypothetical protein
MQKARHHRLLVPILSAVLALSGVPGALRGETAASRPAAPVIPNFWDPQGRVERPPAGAIPLIRFLQLLRDALDLDKLTVAAIERNVTARYRTLSDTQKKPTGK